MIHPDKCHHTRAQDAFDALSQAAKALQVLATHIQQMAATVSRYKRTFGGIRRVAYIGLALLSEEYDMSEV